MSQVIRNDNVETSICLKYIPVYFFFRKRPCTCKREKKRKGGGVGGAEGGRENLKHTECPVQISMWVSISRPWVHDPSQNQESELTKWAIQGPPNTWQLIKTGSIVESLVINLQGNKILWYYIWRMWGSGGQTTLIRLAYVEIEKTRCETQVCLQIPTLAWNPDPAEWTPRHEGQVIGKEATAVWNCLTLSLIHWRHKGHQL